MSDASSKQVVGFAEVATEPVGKARTIGGKKRRSRR